jgi:hypothetical protein
VPLLLPLSLVDAERPCLRLRRHSPGGPDLSVLTDRDHTKVAVHIQADRETDPSSQRHASPPVKLTVRWENQRDNDKDRCELEAQSKQVAGAAERKARARSPSIKTAYPTAFSQTKPLSRMTGNLCPTPDRASERQFHTSKRTRRTSDGPPRSDESFRAMRSRPVSVSRGW